MKILPFNLHAFRQPILAIALMVLLPVYAATAQSQGLSIDDHRCMQCHGQAHIARLNPQERASMVGTWLDPDHVPAAPATLEGLMGDEPPVRPGLFVQIDLLAVSPHAKVSCVECHEDAARLPHAATLNRATCAMACHSDAWENYSRSSHSAALERGDRQAPTCSSCHGGHEILRVTDRRAAQHRLNSLHLCGDCHKQHAFTDAPMTPAQRVSGYLTSVHARGVMESGLLWSASCADCHGAHGVLPSTDPQSSVHRSHIPRTCGQCHEGVVEKYSRSVHGSWLASADKDNESREPIAICTDCHTGHQITRADEPQFLADVINECGQCHDNPARNGERIGTYYRTYHESYHGQATRLGGKRAARCSDCHGAHDILPLDDPASRVSKANLVATCGQAECHPRANAQFVRFDPHANHRDSRNYPVLHGIWLYFMIMMTGVFSFFGLHTVLWFIRSTIERRAHAYSKKNAETRSADALQNGARIWRDGGQLTQPTQIRRFTALNRINHALVAITFFGLTATGIPLLFADKAWAKYLAGVVGGVEAAGLWHRVFAVLLIANLTLHFVGLGRAFAKRTGRWHRWFFGPNSLVPRWKDVTDCIGMFRWFFGFGPKPRFDRWTYWEKFDYWAEVFGSLIIGGSGLLLWFPETASLLVPGWAFNVATIVHGYEALLAIGFIFTIHFFNAHIRPGTFPVDEVIFTGSLPEEHLKHERPAEYERLVQSGQLEALRVPAPPPSRRPLLIVVAAVSVAVGVTLLTLIILGGLGVV